MSIKLIFGKCIYTQVDSVKLTDLLKLHFLNWVQQGMLIKGCSMENNATCSSKENHWLKTTFLTGIMTRSKGKVYTLIILKG